MIELPPDETASRFRGSRLRVDPLMTYLYCWPALAAGTSLDQTPVVPSCTSGVAVLDQLLKDPATRTLVALGAQTRKGTPPARGADPQPVRADCARKTEGTWTRTKSARQIAIVLKVLPFIMVM